MDFQGTFALLRQTRELMLRETVVPTVEQVYRKWIQEIRETKKMKNGHEVPCEPYAHTNERILEFLSRFVKEKYGCSFSNLQFADITEQFMKDYVFFIESEGAKTKSCGGLRGKLHSLYQVVKKASKKNVPGAVWMYLSARTRSSGKWKRHRVRFPWGC